MKRFIAPAVFWGYLIVQAVIPAVQLVSGRGLRWGWQMYAGGGDEPPRVFVVFESGEELRVGEVSVLGKLRPEMALSDELVRRICSSNPRVRAVRIERGHKEELRRCP